MQSRREFVQLAAAGALLPPTVMADGLAYDPATAQAGQAPDNKVSANDRIRLGLIGAGGQGSSDVESVLKTPGVDLVAVADIYDGRRERAQEVWGGDKNKLFSTRDYRELLGRPDVDAVIVATPDHWHATVCIDAMTAGKDVYCEKPMVQQVDEGLNVVEASHTTGRIFQVGSQRVSSIVYAKAKELLASGAIGELNMVEAFWDRNSAIGAWQYSIPPDATPPNIDWDRFLGRAPKRPFEPIRLFRWRNYRDYGTGVPGDLFVHLFSGIHFVTGSHGPTRVMSTGGLRFWRDGRDVPDVMMGLYDYQRTASMPPFNLALKVNFADGAGESSTFRFVGTDGSLVIDGNRVIVSRRAKAREPGYTIGTFAKATQAEFLKEYRAKYPVHEPEMTSAQDETHSAPGGYSDGQHHLRNFIASVRTRKPVVEDATFGFRAAGPALLTNLSYFENKPQLWDPEGMQIVKG
jgi:predicted dehydrogenase